MDVFRMMFKAFVSLLFLIALSESADLVSLSPIELDGNPTTQSRSDWDALLFGGEDVDGVALVSVVQDGTSAQDTIFTGGSSKDIHQPREWLWTLGTPQDKANLVNVAASAARVTDEEGLPRWLLLFSAERYANDGDTTLGIWFFRGSVSLNDDGAFSGVHSDGDILLLLNFGNPVSEVQVYMWNSETSRPELVDSPTSKRQPGKSQEEFRCQSGTDQPWCAITNTNPESFYPGEWFDYVAKPSSAVGDNTYPVATFVEGAIDLTAITGSRDLGCFTRFMVETRASSSITSTLSDFAFGSFELCGMDAHVECTSAVYDDDAIELRYRYNVTVANTGLPLFDLEMTDATSGSVQTLDSNPFETSHTFQLLYVTTSQDVPVPDVTVTAKDVNDVVVVADVLSVEECVFPPRTIKLTSEVECSVRFDASDDSVCLAAENVGSVCNTGEASLTNVYVDNVLGDYQTTDNVDRLRPGECTDVEGDWSPNRVGEYLTSLEGSGENAVYGTTSVGTQNTCASCDVCA